MDISYFKEFSVLAETLNYWEAAERLFISQSTLSKHIHSMEKELDVPLFSRTTRRVELTEYGTALLPYAQAIVKTQFDYSSMLMQKKNRAKSLVAIGTIPVMAQYQITPLLLDFQKACPECGLQVTEDDPKNLKNLLSEQKCELVFLRELRRPEQKSFETEDGIVHLPYISDRLVALLPNGHPLAEAKEISLPSLRDEKFCFLKESSMMYDLCRRACQEAGFIPNIVFDSHRLDSIFDMVTYGGCVSLLMDRHTADPLNRTARKPFTTVPVTPAISTQISLCYRKDAALSEGARRFLTFFRERKLPL